MRRVKIVGPADWEIISFVQTLCHAARRREFRGRFPVFREKTHHQYVLTNHLPHWSKRLAAKSDNLCSVPSALGRQQEALWCCAEFVQKFLAEAYLVFFQVRLRSCTRQRWTQLCATHLFEEKITRVNVGTISPAAISSWMTSVEIRAIGCFQLANWNKHSCPKFGTHFRFKIRWKPQFFKITLSQKVKSWSLFKNKFNLSS